MSLTNPESQHHKHAPIRQERLDLHDIKLSNRTIHCLTTAGIPIDKEAVRQALKSGVLYPHRCPRNYGTKTHAEVCRWVGVDQ